MPESAKPNSSCPDLPPELARHPKYRILRELGRGGMGIVYLARQTGMMDRQVVIKVINRSLIDNAEVLARFRREVKAASQMSHPNIVTAYDAEQTGNLHLLVMEFVPGHNLADVLDAKGPLPVTSACHYVRQAARALQHAHERGMVHRDIKPENLMLTPQNQIKVLDFGIAKVVSEQNAGTGLTASNSYVGTPEYSAPEQITDARSADVRADLYSLGCTLYCLLSGRPPFQEDTAMKTLLAHLQKEPQPLPQLRPEVPEGLWRVVSRLLAKEPRQRYQKPSEVVQALTPFVKSGSKPEAKSGPTPVVGSPEKGTVIAGETRRLQNPLREVPGKAPPTAVLAKDEVAWLGDLLDSSAPPRKAKEAQEATPRVPAPGCWRWLVLVGVGVLLTLLGLWASGIFKVKTKDGTIVLENLPADAEVLVDGKTVTLKAGDGKTITITAGTKHQLEVKKEGFKVFGEVVEIEAGERRPIRVTLRRESPPLQPPPVPPVVVKDKNASNKSEAPPIAKPETTKPETEKPVVAAPPSFVPLFDGKDLTGWKTTPGRKGGWRVEKGVLFWSRQDHGWLGTEHDDFTDFHLRVEVRISHGGYGQLIVREGTNGGYACVLNSTNGNPDKTGSLGVTGGGTPVRVSKSLVPPGQWFTLEVIAEGNLVVIKVNGRTTADYRDLKRRFTSGRIALQHRTPRVAEFRKIEIKELK